MSASDPPARLSRPLIFTVCGLSLLSLAVLASSVPLGVPGEWVWQRHDLTGARLDVLIGVALATVCGAVGVAIVWALRRRVPHASRGGLALILVGLVAGTFAWLWVVQRSAPLTHAQLKPMWILYDPGASGYFLEAVERVDNVRDWLGRYEEHTATGDVLHQGTHPPGLILLHRVCLSVCRRSPASTELIMASCPTGVREAFATVERGAGLRAPLASADRAALWLAVLVTHAFAALTIIPLYLLLRTSMPRMESWLLTGLWPFVPGVALFLPKSDAIYPVFGCLFLWLFWTGIQRGSWLRGALAGLTIWVGCWFSLALLPVAAIAAVLSAGSVWLSPTRPQTPIRLAGAAVPAAVVFLSATLATWLTFDLNLLNVWSLNLRNHAAFYAQYERHWLPWMAANLGEVALTLGTPLSVLAITALVIALKSRERNETWLVTVGVWSVWAILWLSGKNSGEAARLWLFLTPLWIWSVTFLVRKYSDSFERWWLLIIALQMITCIATTALVSGFGF